MTELEKVKRAKLYIERLANGFNPLDGQIAPDDSILNNIRVSRCLFYVSSILEQVIANGGKVEGRRPRVPFVYDKELIKLVPISDRPITLSEIIKNIKKVQTVRLPFSHVAILLKNKGVLIDNPNGKPRYIASPNAVQLGIWSEIIQRAEGDYQRTQYDANGQRYVLECLKDLGD